jgi:nucleoside-diphosphate-sugar epimerase
MINYLITGGTGFIGSNLVRWLIQKKLGDIFLITEKQSDLWRIQDLVTELNIFEADLTDCNSVNNIINTIRPNVIFHLASYGGLPTQADHKKIFDVNFYGTVNLLNACKEVGFECFVNTGSSSEYGIKDQAMCENDTLCPVSDYGVSKAAATQFCLKEAIFNKLPVYTVRPFSVYGEYEMLGRPIPTILIGAIQKSRINLSSEGFVRDFIYVQDIVDVYLNVAKTKSNKQLIFNAGSGVQSTIRDVVNAIELIMDSKLDVSWNSSVQRPWEPKVWQADMSLTGKVLCWQPQYSLKDGLEKTLKWYEKNINFYVKNYETTKSCGTKSISV